MQALFSNLGYTYLDVRPSIELEEVGKVRGSVNIGIKNAKRKYNTEKGKKVLEKSDNPDFVAQVRLASIDWGREVLSLKQLCRG
jgi:hypothetical protein